MIYSMNRVLVYIHSINRVCFYVQSQFMYSNNDRCSCIVRLYVQSKVLCTVFTFFLVQVDLVHSS